MSIALLSLIFKSLLGLDGSLHLFSAILTLNPPFFSVCCCSRFRIRFWIRLRFAPNSAALACHCTEIFLPAQKFQDASDSHLVRSLLAAQINLKMIEQIAHQ